MWTFIQDEILGMKWLNRLIGRLLSLCGLDIESKVGGSVQFFLYDTIKIMVLLGILILLISYIQSFFPPERSKRILGRFNGIGARIIAALLGTVTPFCSCSSIPLFIGFTSAGLPLGVTFSFLISSPMVDLGSLVLLMSIFGWKVAIVYVVLGLVIAVAGGTLIEKLHLENQVQEFIRNGKAMDLPQEELQTKYNDYMDRKAQMTELIRSTKEQEIRDLDQRIQTYQQNAKQKLQEKETELLQPIIDRAKQAIADVAKENGYTYIFDTSAGTLLYQQDSDDIFALVKKKLGLK